MMDQDNDHDGRDSSNYSRVHWHSRLSILSRFLWKEFVNILCM